MIYFIIFLFLFCTIPLCLVTHSANRYQNFYCLFGLKKKKTPTISTMLNPRLKAKGLVIQDFIQLLGSKNSKFYCVDGRSPS